MRLNGVSDSIEGCRHTLARLLSTPTINLLTHFRYSYLISFHLFWFKYIFRSHLIVVSKSYHSFVGLIYAPWSSRIKCRRWRPAGPIIIWIDMDWLYKVIVDVCFFVLRETTWNWLRNTFSGLLLQYKVHSSWDPLESTTPIEGLKAPPYFAAIVIVIVRTTHTHSQ